ncbi:Ribosome recycling factor isoform 2 [Theobroma cacao]|uniref:Ribosome-recycling factor, chloroplastic n=1 Tax=Theobroma cacao TaxID=3641 RepID=A0A061DPY9_THECC|nr:Ribosome recycling factor isoform 2 [Theobroma cacao]
MAAPFSSTSTVGSIFRPNPNPPKSFLSPSDSFQKGFDCVKCRSTDVNVYSWSSAANYARLRHGASKLSGKPFVVLRKRAGVLRCATIEEIEAEKSSIEKDAKARMEKTIETVRTNFNSIRTGRANPAILDKVEVEYYGTPVSLKSIAQISTPDSSSLLVQPYDKSSLKAIEKAIVNSDLGMTPNNDGEVIRLSLPQLTTERRKELSKVVAKQAEEGKVAVRNIRRDALKAYEKLEKEKKLSEDNVKDLSSDLQISQLGGLQIPLSTQVCEIFSFMQKLTDEYMKKIDSIFKQKEKELLTV